MIPMSRVKRIMTSAAVSLRAEPRRLTVLGWAGLALAAPAWGQGLEGDPDRGRGLYEETYKCYACHGYDAQSIEPRLKPLNFTQDGFVTFVQNSPLPLMPAYPDAPAQDLADIYAYIRSIPEDAPEVDEVPLLRAIRDGQAEAFD